MKRGSVGLAPVRGAEVFSQEQEMETPGTFPTQKVPGVILPDSVTWRTDLVVVLC